MGAVYRASVTTDYENQTRIRLAQEPGFDPPPTTRTVSGRVTWPNSYALGLAFHPLEVCTVALDYSHASWSDAVIESPDLRENWNFPNKFAPQRDTEAWRLGGEWIFQPGKLVVPLRAGLFTEDQISGGFERRGAYDGDFSNSPAEIKGFSLGSGIGVSGPKLAFSFDLAWVRSEADDSVDYTFFLLDDFNTVESLTARSDFSSDRIIASARFQF